MFAFNTEISLNDEMCNISSICARVFVCVCVLVDCICIAAFVCIHILQNEVYKMFQLLE